MLNYSSTDNGLRWWAQNKPNKRFIVFQGNAVTFAEADEWVDRVAIYLAESGINIGDRVGLIGPNSVEWAIASLAVLRIGGVHAGVSERSTATELRAQTSYTGTRSIIASEGHMAAVRDASAMGPEFNVLSLAEVSKRRTGQRVRYERPDIDADEVAAIIYTSGSTGAPKGVVFTMRSLMSIIQEWSLTDPALSHEARIVGVLPLAPIGGFINSILRPSVLGGTVFLLPKFDEKEALRLLIEERCSSLMAVPLIFQRISALPEFQQADLSSLTYAIIGGAPVPLDEFDKWFERGASLRQTYGLTESGGHFSVTPIDGARENRASWGRGNIYRKIKVVRPDGTKCAPNEDGEIVVRGPGVMEGYWDNDELNAAVLRNGWLHTGDIGRVDETGRGRVTGRLKELIITGGYNVGPNEIENVLRELQGVKEAAVIPVIDQTYGEAVGAILWAQQVTVEEIVAHCRIQLAGYKVPRYVLIVDEPLPRTEQGKFSKVDMKKKYANALANSPRPS